MTGTTAGQKTVKKLLNGYLAAEYGFEDEGLVSDSWPFELHPSGTIQLPEYQVYVFEFFDGTESSFALAGQSLSCFSTEGMSFDQLRVLMLGSYWIDSRQPIDLNTSRVGDGVAPGLHQRQDAILELAARALPADSRPQIGEGLFLRQPKEYLVLVEHSVSKEAVIIGTNIEPWPARLATKSAWKKLAFGIGEMIVSGRLALS